MASECFNLSDKIESVEKIINEGTIICIGIACLMALIIVYGIYADSKKPTSSLKIVSDVRNNVFVAPEEFKEFEDSVDQEAYRPS